MSKKNKKNNQSHFFSPGSLITTGLLDKMIRPQSSNPEIA